MDCKSAERLVNDYIDEKLSPKQLEEFIEHVKVCPSCYEELETYYILRVGMHYLDNNVAHSYNIKEMLLHDLHMKEQSVKRYKRNNVLFGFFFGLGIILIGVIIFFESKPEYFQGLIDYLHQLFI